MAKNFEKLPYSNWNCVPLYPIKNQHHHHLVGGLEQARAQTPARGGLALTEVEWFAPLGSWFALSLSCHGFLGCPLR